MSFKTVAGPNNVPMVEVGNRAASAKILALGAHLISYIPVGGEELMYMSPMSHFAEGKAIRGGVPVCWPWFSKHPVSPSLPSHGFVRTMMWEFVGAEEPSDDTTVVTMQLKDSAASHAIWDFKFTLQAIFTVGKTLSIKLAYTNDDTKPFTVTEAFHTYFRIGDVSAAKVHGLDGKTFFDKAGGANDYKVQCGDIAFAGEHDAVYFGNIPEVQILDGALKRTVTIRNSGNASAVVWNPWIAKAASMADFPDDDYKRMLCVETTNAMSDTRTVAPGQTCAMAAEYVIG